MLDHSDSSSSSLVIVNGEGNDLDYEVENSFSMISDFIEDEFSWLSYCGSSSGEIELSPAVKCYRHSRNAKLNKKLDLAVVLSFVLVAGLGIGNFIGQTSNCIHPYIYDLYDSIDMNPLKQMMCNKEAQPDFIKKLEYQASPFNSQLAEGISEVLNVKSSKNENNLSTEEDIAVDNSDLLSVEISNNTDELIPQESHFQKRTVVDDIPLLGDQDFGQNLELILPLAGSIIKYPEVTNNIGEKMNFSDILDVLNNDIRNVIHQMQSLVLSTMPEESINFKVTNLDNMFQKFYTSIDHKSEELNSLVSTFSLETLNGGKKQFMKMSHIILKSVDKMLKNNFIKILLNDKRTLSHRLKNICNIGYDVIEGLEKRWYAEKRKLMLHLNKEKKFDNFKYDKYKARNVDDHKTYKYQDSHNKQKYEKKSEYHKSKQNYVKNDQKQMFYKKRY